MRRLVSAVRSGAGGCKVNSTQRFVRGSSRPHERARSPLAKQRLHDILRSDRERERDAQLASVEKKNTPAPSDGAHQRLPGTSDEPIRTRSMARLLASQGEPARALAIYEALIAIGCTDATLYAELEAARLAASPA
jgi:hypothetical protein